MITIRNINTNDKAFVYATWLKGYRHGNTFLNLVPSDSYFKQYAKIIDAVLATPGLNARIACLTDDPDVVLGYAILEPARNLGHFAYVKEAWRSRGVLKLLMQNTRIEAVTHITKQYMPTFLKKQLIFDPFMLMFNLNEGAK